MDTIWLIEVRHKAQKSGWEPTGADWYYRRKDARLALHGYVGQHFDYRVAKYSRIAKLHAAGRGK